MLEVKWNILRDGQTDPQTKCVALQSSTSTSFPVVTGQMSIETGACVDGELVLAGLTVVFTHDLLSCLCLCPFCGLAARRLIGDSQVKRRLCCQQN